MYCLCSSTTGRNKIQCIRQLNNVKLPSSLAQSCARIYEKVECEADIEYRTADGTCNNIESPLWGRSNTEYRRLLQPDYEDGMRFVIFVAL
jgi:hypothetical protein